MLENELKVTEVTPRDAFDRALKKIGISRAIVEYGCATPEEVPAGQETAEASCRDIILKRGVVRGAKYIAYIISRSEPRDDLSGIAKVVATFYKD